MGIQGYDGELARSDFLGSPAYLTPLDQSSHILKALRADSNQFTRAYLPLHLAHARLPGPDQRTRVVLAALSSGTKCAGRPLRAPPPKKWIYTPWLTSFMPVAIASTRPLTRTAFHPVLSAKRRVESRKLASVASGSTASGRAVDGARGVADSVEGEGKGERSNNQTLGFGALLYPRTHSWAGSLGQGNPIWSP